MLSEQLQKDSLSIANLIHENKLDEASTLFIDIIKNLKHFEAVALKSDIYAQLAKLEALSNF